MFNLFEIVKHKLNISLKKKMSESNVSSRSSSNENLSPHQISIEVYILL